MKYTNLLNLPAVMAAAVTRDTYNRGISDFTVTELLTPPRVGALKKLHEDEITEDVADVIYRLIGSIGHGILERASDNGGDIIERRFYSKFHVDGVAYTVSGQADLVREHPCEPFVIWDWKFSSLYQFKDGVKPEYIAQLNMLRVLAQKNGIEVSGLNSAAVYRDWSKPKSRRESDYPKQQLEVFPVDVWSFSKTEAFIKERIALHVAASTELPECSDVERWADATTYAVKKQGAARAMSDGVFTNLVDASQFASVKGGVVEVRRGISKRCADYCSASPFCSQWQKLKEEEAA